MPNVHQTFLIKYWMTENAVHRIRENFKKSPQMRDLPSRRQLIRARACVVIEKEIDRRRKKKRIRGKNEKVTDAMRAT